MELSNYNIAAHLPHMAEMNPYRQAVIFPSSNKDSYENSYYTCYSYKKLEVESNIIAAGLIKYGLKKGTRTVLMVKPSLEFFALTFALFKLGAVPVLIDPGMGIKNLKKCLQEAEPEVFIGIPKAHIARILFGWQRGKFAKLITVGGPKFWGGEDLLAIRKMGLKEVQNFQMIQSSPKDLAAILFTSGSTGVPKGVLYSHENFNTQISSLKKLFNIELGEVDLCTFPLFALFAPALGMTAVIPIMDFTRPAHVDPENIFKAIEDFGVTNMFGSPALINRVSEAGVSKNIKLKTLKRVVSAGAPVQASIMAKMQKLLGDGVEIFTPYGATESLPVSCIGSLEVLNETSRLTDQGKGICVGRPVESIEVKVIKISDSSITDWSSDIELPNYEIGEIVVSGPQVTTGYFNRENSNLLSKIKDSKSGVFYHRMGDLGYRDDSGRIWFCGRKSHRVELEKSSLYTIPCEAIFNRHGEVFRSALVGVESKKSVKPVICVETETPLSKDRQAILRADLLKEAKNNNHTKDIDIILFKDQFPVDIRHNAKIFREKLASWAREELQ